MSPVATNGPDHTRGSSLNGRPVNPLNGAKANGMDRVKGMNRVFQHLEDLCAVRPNTDINSPLQKLLADGETLAKQADSHLDFQLPDIALQEYIQASIIAVEMVPRHKDYPSLQANKGDLHRRYNGLTKRITTQHQTFAEVKEAIKENNARSGVKPLSKNGQNGAVTNGVQNGHARTQSTTNGSATNGAPEKKKPPVQPKPESLLGNVIQHGNTADLAARFANLRSPKSQVPVQDPRIRTQPITIPGLTGSNTSSPPPGNYTINRRGSLRDLPSVPRTIPRTTPITLNTEIPGMPKPPAAVYDSPIRGPEAATANLLSSRNASYRGSYKDSAPPISTVGPTPTLVDNRQDYFSSATGDEYHQKSKKPPPVLSDSPTVTAEELVDLLAQSSQSFRILLVDLRSREEFDNGHIMSQFIICVEPITLKHGISGDQLADSMVIAPDQEQNLYDQRNEFDLIVFYDQSSTSLKPIHLGTGETENTLKDFVSAVTEFGYEKEVKRRPKLLSGGLDAWVDILGANSLKTSLDGASSSHDASHKRLKPARPLARQPLAQGSNNPMKRRRTYSSRPLSKEDEKRWDEKMKEENAARPPLSPGDENAEDLVYARTTEDFFRRYPELPAIQESMVAPVSRPSTPKTYHEELASVIPRPPARPPPALPRQRSSGISERGAVATYAHTTSTGDSITNFRVPPGLTGLQNPNNVCYMNAAIQALSATPFLRDLLVNYQYPPLKPIPRKENEATDPPQLMVRSLGNLLGHLWSGQYDYVTPNTFKASQHPRNSRTHAYSNFKSYVNSVHVGKQTNTRIRELAYGGSQRQHDSMEFLLFLIEILMDELNPTRNLPDWYLKTDAERLSLNREPSCLWAAYRFREKFMANKTSILAQNTDAMEMSIIRCKNCQVETRNFQNNSLKAMLVKPHPRTQNLVDAITADLGPRTQETIDFACENCGTKNEKGSYPVIEGLGTSVRYHAWLPDYLWISLNRYGSNLQKIDTTFLFPETEIDLTPTFAPDTGDAPQPLPRQQTGPFLYDVYAVIQHGGGSIAHGHYWTIAKSLDKRKMGGKGAGSWHKFNDMQVSEVGFEATQNYNTSAIFLKRQGSR